MLSAGRERGNGIRKQPAGGAKLSENGKKILNRGNEPKDLLKPKDLADFGAKNEPKTNPILSAKMGNQSAKAGPVESRNSRIEIRNSKPGSADPG
jgi:hypothetical protein